MKKIAIVLVLMLILTSCAEREMDKLGAPKTKQEKAEGAKVTEEDPKAEAEKVSNKGEQDLPAGVQFEDAINKDQYEGFTDSQIEQLNKYGFIVMEQNQDGSSGAWIDDRYHSQYERANYHKMPVYVTTDAVLNAFDIFYSGSMMNLEITELYFAQAKLCFELTDELIKVYNENEEGLLSSDNEAHAKYDPALKEPLEDAIAYMYTATRLFMQKEIEFNGDRAEDEYPIGEQYKTLKDFEEKIEKTVPENAKKISDLEYKRVLAAEGLLESELFGYDVDYSQFKPRGHYTAATLLEDYFMGMMWLGNPGLELEENPRATKTALIVATALNSREDLLEAWDKTYDITSYYSSSSDDINVYDLADIINNVLHFEENGYKNIVNPELVSNLNEEIKKLREPKIKPETFEGSTNDLSTVKQFRFMGQRYSADQFILTKLIKAPEKTFASSFEFFGILGNEKAKEIFDELYHPQDIWPEYEEKYQFTKDIYDIKKDIIFSDDMYHNYLKVIELCLNNPVDKDNPNVPKLMKTDAYDYMRINSALGAFAQLKHANVLYTKQMAAEAGGAPPEPAIHYLEPNVELYQELARTLRQADKKLKTLGISDDDNGHSRFNPASHFAEKLDIFAEIARKELAGESLNENELLALEYFGMFCDAMADDVAFLNYKTGIKVDTKFVSRPVVSDIATIHGQAGFTDMYLELGIGMPLDIYVLVEQNDEKVLAKGVLFSSYEFYHNERLTDEDWDKLICIKGTENDWQVLGLNPDMKLTKVMPYTKNFISEEENHVKVSEEALNW